MATNLIMPSLGFDMTEGKLARWLKQEGERIEKGQPIAEIETEKATVEIEASASGVLRKIIVPPDKTVPIGTIIGVIGEPNEALPETAPAAAPAMATATAPTPPRDNGQRDVVVAPSEERIKASPIARKMAAEAGIDLAAIKGTGPGGRVMDRDVQAAIAAHAVPRTVTAPVAPSSATVPLNKMRQAIARRMTESKTTAPHFYVTVVIDMAEAMKMREQLNAAAPEEEKISVNDLIVAAVARALLKFPTFNASYRNDALEMHPQINVGIAVALDDGLITPVLRDADKKSLKTIAQESRALSERARANRLRADDLTGGTFTVSNLGMFGVDEFSAIINPPQAAILAVGAVTRQPIAVGGEVQIAPLMKATLSVDHRVADGAQAARFMREFKTLLANPMNLLMN